MSSISVWSEADAEAIAEVLRHGDVSSYSNTINAWESRFGAWLGFGSAVAVSSGTSALVVALKALKIGIGDSVAVPSLTFASSVQAILAVGATPVFVDVDPFTWCISLESLGEALDSGRIRCVIAVHLFGNICDLRPIACVCIDRGIDLVEDGAQALGSNFDVLDAGFDKRLVAFSFDSRKQLPLGQGGMLVAGSYFNTGELKSLRHCGLTQVGQEYLVTEQAINHLPNVFTAALGISSLNRLDSANEQRSAFLTRLELALRAATGVRTLRYSTSCRAAPHRIPLVFDSVQTVARVRSCAKAASLPLNPLYRPLHMHPLFSSMENRFRLPFTEHFADHNLCLDLNMSDLGGQLNVLMGVLREANLV